MYIDELAKEDIIEFIKTSLPESHYAKKRIANLDEGYFEFVNGLESELYRECSFSVLNPLAEECVKITYRFDDFTCFYRDEYKNSKDYSDRWCEFVCGSINDSQNYAKQCSEIIDQQLQDLETKYNADRTRLDRQKNILNTIANESVMGD